jgi:hypothetical protein
VKILKTLTLALLITTPAYAQQGVVMVMNNTTAGGQAMQTRMQMDPTHVRTEMRDQRGQQVAVTFDSGAGVMRMIDDRNKSYTEITEADLKKMAQMMADLQKQLGGRGIPGLGGRGIPGIPGSAPPPERITYKKTGSSTVGQWACTTYDGFRGAEKVAEICAAEGSLNLGAADFQVVQRLADMMRTLNPQGVDQLATYGSAEQGFAGFPVRNVSLRNGKPESTSELAELRREAIPATVFAAPAGYKKQEMNLGR